jgi:hypothetical protein
MVSYQKWTQFQLGCLILSGEEREDAPLPRLILEKGIKNERQKIG